MTDTAPPLQPVVARGKLHVFESQDASAAEQTIRFQYNPEQVVRKLKSRAPEKDGNSRGNAKEEALRVEGPPEETITIAIELDAADQLEKPDGNEAVVEHGLNPALAILEMLLYPPTLRVQENEQLAAAGEVQVTVGDLPLVMLELDAMRIMPVKLTSLSITEEAFDTRLNPLRAKVDLSLLVLTYLELEPDTQGYKAFVAYQRNKENLAAMHPSTGASA